MYAYANLCMNIYIIYMLIFFAMSVVCILEQVFWASVHVQVYTKHRCFCLHQRTHLRHTRCRVHIFVYMHKCMYMHTYVYGYVCASMMLLDTLRRRCWHFWSVYRCVYTCICIRMCMYVCIFACPHVCICTYMCLCVCMHIHVYTYACECAHALVRAHLV